MLPRSCNKPLQALGMVRLGLDLPPSCWRWRAPRTRVSRSTSRAPAGSWPLAGLDESALQTPPDYPLDDAARDVVIRAGGGRDADADELLGQARGDARHLRASTAGTPRPTASPTTRCSGDPARHVRRADRRAGDDGRRSTAAGRRCFSTSLVGLARAFRRLALGHDGATATTRQRGASPRRSARTRSTSPAPRATSAPC